MIRAGDGCLEVSGAMTLPCATGLLAEGKAAFADPETVLDLAAVTDVDSSSLAVIFGWQREAQRLGKTILIAHPPKEMLVLAEVYGVAELLPLA